MDQLKYLDRIFLHLYGINGLMDYDTKITAKQYADGIAFLEKLNAEIANLKKYFGCSTLNLKRKNYKIDNVSLALSILKKCLTKANIPYEYVHTSTNNYLRLIPVNKLLHVYINEMNNIVHSPAATNYTTNRKHTVEFDDRTVSSMISGIKIKPEHIEKLHSLTIGIGGSTIWNINFNVLCKLGSYDGVSLTWPTKLFFPDQSNCFLFLQELTYHNVEINVKTMLRDEHLPYEIIVEKSPTRSIPILDTFEYIYAYQELEKTDTHYKCDYRLPDGFFILSSNLTGFTLTIDGNVQKNAAQQITPDLYWLPLRPSKPNWDTTEIDIETTIIDKMKMLMEQMENPSEHNIILEVNGDAKVYVQLFNKLKYTSGMAGKLYCYKEL